MERLRQRRCKRLGIKSTTSLSGQAKILQIFDRGTKKHPGDLALWISYMEYLKASKANKKLKSILTVVIRLHPTESELWIYAARWALESEMDMNGARSYMQRGIRFCTSKSELWIEYAKLEMIYLAKIQMRRKILQLDDETPKDGVANSNDPKNELIFSGLQDMVSITDFNKETPRLDTSHLDSCVDSEARMDIMKTPALNGGIPIAIFDAAHKQSFFCASVAANFFDMFTTFSQIYCSTKVLHHVVQNMLECFPADSATWSCFTIQPLIGIDQLSPDFPKALRLSLERVKESLQKTSDKDSYKDLTKDWIKKYFNIENSDPGIRAVIQHLILELD